MDYSLQKKSVKNSADLLFEFIGTGENVNIDLLNYFSIDSAAYLSANDTAKYDIIYLKSQQLYKKHNDLFNEKMADLKQILSVNFSKIDDELQNIFKIEIKNKITINFGICPFCPRFLDDFAFDVCVFEPNGSILQTIVHELIHFYWFAKIEGMGYNLTANEKEIPSLTWLLSEIVVDAIFKNSNLKQFLFNNTPAYQIFYNSQIGGENVIEVFDKIFKNSKNIEDFVNKSMDYLKENKSELELLASKC